MRPSVPWFTEEIKEPKVKRRKLEKKMKKSNLPSDTSAYKRACYDYCATLKEAKKDHYANLIQECAGDSRKLFQIVNSLCKERSGNLLPPHANPQQLADDFGEYFCRKIALIEEDISSSVEPSDFAIPSPVVKLACLPLFVMRKYMISLCLRPRPLVSLIPSPPG